MQKEFLVKINTIERVKEFVDICNRYNEDIDLSSGRYIIDAKSIMGIFSFDILKPLTIHIHSDKEEVVNRFNEEMRKFKI